MDRPNYVKVINFVGSAIWIWLKKVFIMAICVKMYFPYKRKVNEKKFDDGCKFR